MVRTEHQEHKHEGDKCGDKVDEDKGDRGGREGGDDGANVIVVIAPGGLNKLVFKKGGSMDSDTGEGSNELDKTKREEWG